MEIISKTYNEIEVIFSTEINKNLYINATKIAKEFNKLPADWLKTKETKSYIEAVSRYDNIHNGDLVVVKRGGNDKNSQGTWIHKKLIIAFARWLLPDFAVWCDTQIEDILTSKNLEIVPKPKNLISVSDSELDRELKTLKFILDNFNLSEKEKIKKSNEVFQNINFIVKLENPHFKKREPVFTLTQLLAEFGISILTKDFNLKLESFGIIERFGSGWILLEMRFGENRETQNGKNHRYFKTTFQELLDIVL